VKVVLAFSFLYVVVVAILARKKLPELHPRRFFLETWEHADREAAIDKALRAALYRVDGSIERRARFDWRPLTAYVSFALVLTLQEYFGDRGTFYRLRDRGWVIDWGGGPTGAATKHLQLLEPMRWLENPKWGELFALSYWVITRASGYVLVPAVIIWLWRERVRDYGFRTKGFLDHAWIYALFFGIVLIAVVLVSQTSEFANYYPFYREANRSWTDFFLWESMYALQFLALEFYFRGFLVFSSEKSMGSGVVMAMVVPYCMIHFGKPVLETLGAIIAGTVLGTLALKTRSIWSGFLIHVTVAVAMDLAALLQTRGLPGGFRLPTSWNF
jgi:membrane protease YdiL (CAAX protease family)